MRNALGLASGEVAQVYMPQHYGARREKKTKEKDRESERSREAGKRVPRVKRIRVCRANREIKGGVGRERERERERERDPKDVCIYSEYRHTHT